MVAFTLFASFLKVACEQTNTFKGCYCNVSAFKHQAVFADLMRNLTPHSVRIAGTGTTLKIMKTINNDDYHYLNGVSAGKKAVSSIFRTIADGAIEGNRSTTYKLQLSKAAIAAENKSINFCNPCKEYTDINSDDDGGGVVNRKALNSMNFVPSTNDIDYGSDAKSFAKSQLKQFTTSTLVAQNDSKDIWSILTWFKADL
ncbi:uncharacterized protein ASCRUDRAFT_15996 [Ascoidea rubescens DSM 1968]|uniref:Uncharacterized protein n=1 Tax=Ascoidea rubescens DSM 1968 TaxID=1344418 RepID=A0A1D2V8Q7_9ASCO|nr:hypothetical protein ASCRUDRAFT_15996 [Ascoidea rubescens DSM 1968]ODV57897.1 hypothetical protein ASCRUDRAFT_15996 [Ascoidea rubescens DSM 1968]